MDEGFYEYMSVAYNQAISRNESFPPMQGLAFWPLLLAWIPELPGMSMLWFRLTDMAMMLIAGWLLCRILQKESSHPWYGILLAFIFLCSMTDKIVIDSGFKNSFSVSWACMFFAFSLTQDVGNRRPFTWFLVGFLIAMGIALRETMFPFAFLGLISIWIGWGFRAALVYSAGGIVCAAVVISGIALIHPDNIHNIIFGYTSRVNIYLVQSYLIWEYFIKNGFQALKTFAGPVLMTSFAIIMFFKFPLPGINKKRALFWLAVALLPLLEPLTKIGFVYHFAVCLPGFAGLCAFLCRYTKWPSYDINIRNIKLSVAPSFLALLLACVLCLNNLPGWRTFSQSMQVISQFPSREWPDNLVQKSNTLLAAKEIKKLLPPGGTLSTNALAYFLYAVTGAHGPSFPVPDANDPHNLTCLSRTFLHMGQNVDKLAKAIMANPPDVVAVAYTHSVHEPPFTNEIIDALEKTGLYSYKTTVKEIIGPEAMKMDNVWLGYKIFSRKPVQNVDGASGKSSHENGYLE